MSQTTEPFIVDPDDFSSNPSPARPFHDIVEARLSRRSVLGGGMLAAVGFFATGIAGAPRAAARPGGVPASKGRGAGLLGFQAIPLGHEQHGMPPALVLHRAELGGCRLERGRVVYESFDADQPV